MANILFAHPNYADPNPVVTPTFSGGSWSPDLPLTNLADRRLALVARSVDAQLASTQFDIDCGVVRSVRVFAIPRHNLSLLAALRIRGSNVAGNFTTPVYDSGWLDVAPVIYPPGSLPWGHPSFWSGRLSTEDAAGYSLAALHVVDQAYVAQYWRIEISDASNPDGYIDLARLFLSDGYQPSINMAYGAKLGWTTSTTSVETDGGATIYTERPMRRTLSLVLDHVPQDEALVSVFEMQRKLGKHGQVFVIFDPEDTMHLHRRSFLASFSELSALDYAYFQRNSIPLSFVEVL